jgi:hypothetical protein
MMNVVLDHAGSYTYVTGAPDLQSVLDAAQANPVNIPSVNIAWVETHTAEELENTSPYPVTEIDFANLESHDRSGCQFDECHNLTEGAEYRDASYCDDHAGPVEDEYADVTVIWGGAVDSIEFGLRTRAEIATIVEDTEKAVAASRAEGTFNEEFGAEVSVSYHTHHFDTRADYDAFEGDCFCESYDTEYDSHKDEAGENGRAA